MDTWTNYLIVQDNPQVMPEELPSLLRRVLFAEKDVVQPTTRLAACAAYGAIRSREVFADLVQLLLRNEPRELRHLAVTASHHVFRWLKKDDPAAFAAIDQDLLEQWARGVDQTDTSGIPLWSGVAQHLAWWERNPLEPTRSKILNLSPEMRKAVESGRLLLDQEWNQASHDINQAGELLRNTAGLEAPTFDRAIWTDSPDQDNDKTLVSRAREEAQASDAGGRLDLVRGDAVPGSNPRKYADPSAKLFGTLFEATYRAGAFRNWESEAHWGYLRFDRPGHVLRVKSLVPQQARELEVRVEHMIGVRSVVRGGGTVAFRIGLVAQRTARDQGTLLPWEYSSIVYNPLTGTSDEAWARLGTATAKVPRHVFDGHKEIEVLLEYVHGNTTYRVMGIELVWVP